MGDFSIQKPFFFRGDGRFSPNLEECLDCGKIIPFYGSTIQVSEILQLTQIFGIFPMGNQSGICGVFVGFLKQVQVCTMVKIVFFCQNK